MTYISSLSSKVARDKAFAEAFLGDYEILFENVDDVINYLKEQVTEVPYYWLGSKQVTAKIKIMAKASYMKSGYGKAKYAIDNMPADKVKEYLKKMIEDNLAVGVEIIKSHK